MLLFSNRTSPSTRVPVIRSFIRFRSLSRVDFPQPEGPISAVTLFLSKDMLMSARARTAP